MNHTLCVREVLFDLIVEKEPFILGMKTLEEAVTSVLYICFAANMEYPKVGIMGGGSIRAFTVFKLIFYRL